MIVKKITISFEKGGSFAAELFEETSPETCQVFWNYLPIEGKPLHMRWAGRGLWLPLADFPKPYPPRENQLSIVGEGYLMFRVDWTGGHQNPTPGIALFYGPEIPRNLGGIMGVRLNWIGRIRENLDELVQVGERIYYEGREKITLKKL